MSKNFVPSPTIPGPTFTTDELIAVVKAHAIENYNNDEGWDYVVEAYEDDYIAEVLGRAWTPAGAIKKVREHLAPVAAYRAEIVNA